MLHLTPLLSQIDLNVNELIATVGVTSFILVLAALAIYRIVTTESKKNLKTTEADVEQQRTVTKMAMTSAEKVMELQAEISKLHESILKQTELRNKDREEYHDLKSDNRELKSTVKTLENTVSQQGKQIAKLEKDLDTEKGRSNRLQRENDRLLELDKQNTNTIAYLRGENQVLKENNESLRKQNADYRRWQGQANTVPIPDIVIEENEDGELITPVIKQSPTTGIADDNQSSDEATQNDESINKKDDAA